MRLTLTQDWSRAGAAHAYKEKLTQESVQHGLHSGLGVSYGNTQRRYFDQSEEDQSRAELQGAVSEASINVLSPEKHGAPPMIADSAHDARRRKHDDSSIRNQLLWSGLDRNKPLPWVKDKEYFKHSSFDFTCI